MAKTKKTRSVKDTLCARCLTTAKFKELNQVSIEMHHGYPEHGYYTVFVCDKCEPKFALDRRKPIIE